MKFKCITCEKILKEPICPKHGSYNIEVAEIKIRKNKLPFFTLMRLNFQKYHNKIYRYKVKDFFQIKRMPLCPGCQKTDRRLGSTFGKVLLCEDCSRKQVDRQLNISGIKHRGKQKKIKLKGMNLINHLKNRRRMEEIKWLG